MLTAGFNLLLLFSSIQFLKEEVKKTALLAWLLSVGLYTISSFFLGILYTYEPKYFDSPSIQTILGILGLVVGYSGAIVYFTFLSKNAELKTILKISTLIVVLNFFMIIISLSIVKELRLLAPSFWGIFISSWLLFQLSKSHYRQNEYLITILKTMAFMVLLPGLIWVSLYIMVYNQIIIFPQKEMLAQFGDVVRMTRNITAPISFFVMFLYWIKYNSKAALFAKEESIRVKNLLIENNILILELSRSNFLISTCAMASGIAHELNQFLTRIKLNAEDALFLIKTNKNYEVFKNPLKKILDSNDDANSLISALRTTFSDSKNTPLKTNLADVIKNVCNLYSGQMTLSKIKMKLELPDQINMTYLGSQFTIVLSNVLLNAIEALDENSNYKKIIIISFSEIDDFIFIKIFNNGGSIELNKVNYIFTLFFTSKKEGMGVGLWLSKLIMDKNGCDLIFKNIDEIGVEFSLKIPKRLLF